ncbi:MAG: type VI secretion protein IcmF/TssM N-terminal domain-containing protein [Desulfatirhabdiaceae bacterium]
MGKFLITALKIFLLLALIAGTVLGAILLADHQGWPRWTVAIVLAGVFCLVVVCLFFRRFYYRRREEKFVKRVVEQDQRAIDAAPAHEKRRLTELQERWRHAIETLRASRLRDRGDPLYSLPWFMIFGESASGKSTAIARARLSSILTDAGPTRGIATTANCDWWFFEKAIILDTAGRYAVPLEDSDTTEWESFLTLLAKYRRKEPLNGLIVTLPTDYLLKGDTDALTAYGRFIRKRVDQLMRVMGARFPIYLLVTKLDLVLGMTALAELLPEPERGQALGLLNVTEGQTPDAFLRDTLIHVSRRLKEMRLLLAERAGKSSGKAALFPDEFDRLAPFIQAFVEGAFHESTYLETPFLRGVFFSSAQQSGLARTEILGELESFKNREWRLPNTMDGLFLHDFFDLILPVDRNKFKQLKEYLSWRKATFNLGLAAWLLLLLAGVGLTSFSYFKIRQSMEPVYQVCSRAPDVGKNLAGDMVTLGLLRDKIAEMEKNMGHSLWPGMGLTQGQDALTALKRHYNHWFRTAVLDPTDKSMNSRFADQNIYGQENDLSTYLKYLVWRVDTLKARESGRPMPATSAQDAPIEALALSFGGRLPEVATFFPDMYRSYAAWEEDLGLLTRERRDLQVWSTRIIETESRDLHWLTDWAATLPNLKPITLDDFWAGLGHIENAGFVSGAFTAQGKIEVENLLAQVSMAVTNPESFKQQSAAFWEWYAKRFYHEWMLFAQDFHLGMHKLLTREDWLGTGASMATLDNPYFNLINRMEIEFEALKNIDPHPGFASLPKRFGVLVHHYRAGQKKAALDEKIRSRIEKLEAGLDRLETLLSAVADFEEYMKQLDAFLPVTASVDAAFRFASQNYGKSAAGGQPSPVEEARGAVAKMRQLVGKGTKDEEPFWRLMEGPMHFLVSLATYETACGLNELWKSQVVAETSSVPEHELWITLFGDQGVVKTFVSGPASPFLRRDRQGWSAGSWIGVSFPFRSQFLKFLDQGSIRRQQIQPKYTVSISTLPTNVNLEAKSEPYLVTLTLQCASKPQQLENYNYPDSLDMVWEPLTCGEVTLEIEFREAVLRQTWTGEWGFRDFLRLFRSGSKTFTPADFPQQKSILDGLGVTEIQVNYTIRGAEPVLAIEDYPPLRVPDQATHCWDGLGGGLMSDSTLIFKTEPNTVIKKKIPPVTETSNTKSETPSASASGGDVP